MRRSCACAVSSSIRRRLHQSPLYTAPRTRAPHETRQLDEIRVWNTSTGSDLLIRKYILRYGACDAQQSVLSDASIGNTSGDTSHAKLTLREIQRVGKDGTLYPAITRLAYHTTRGTQFYPNGGWNRLASVDNGQGGTVSFTYDNIGLVLAPDHNPNRQQFVNNHRVKTKTVTDGRGTSSVWRYSYATPAYNSLGAGMDARSPQQWPTSATLYANSMAIPDANNTPSGARHSLLFAKPFKEFRGHSYVKETDPNGNQHEHYFYQGSADCEPRYAAGHTRAGQLVSGEDIWAEPSLDSNCFLTMRTREILKGRAFKQQTRGPVAAGSPLLAATEHKFDVRFLDWGPDRMIDLWRAWSAQSQLIEHAYEGTATPSTKRTEYIYDFVENRNAVSTTTGSATGQVYGNLTKVREYDQTGVRVRATTYNHAVRDNFVDDPSGAATRDPALGAPYMADRVWVETVLDGSDRFLARTFHLYDNTTVQAGIGYQGARTRSSAISAIPLVTTLNNTTLPSNDTTTTFDAFGNPVTVSTYASGGTATIGTGGWTFSAPGSGSAAATTTTTYDTTFNAYPTEVLTPPNQHGERLLEKAIYDYRMGILTGVIDYNGNTTTATFDSFGRLRTIVKPGDSTSFPTVQASYYDLEQPFRYVVQTREQAGSAEAGILTRFYDGLGREIQSKRESANGSQNIVADTVYDGLGNVVQQSQPRYVNQTGTAFTSYTPHAAAADMRWTTTSYDALNRPRVVTRPDGVTEEHLYDLVNGLRRHHLVDTNRHRTEWRSDALGRLREYGRWRAIVAPGSIAVPRRTPRSGPMPGPPPMPTHRSTCSPA